MNPVIEKALEDWRGINANGRRWASFECIAPDRVELTIGQIHSDNSKECAICTRVYYEHDGLVLSESIIHV